MVADINVLVDEISSVLLVEQRYRYIAIFKVICWARKVELTCAPSQKNITITVNYIHIETT